MTDEPTNAKPDPSDTGACDNAPATGESLHAFAAELLPIGRSLTGQGVRKTLRRLQREIPLEIREVPSGTAVLDWTVPPEWNLREAWIRDSTGRHVVDARQSTLSVLGYSVPVRTVLTLSQLRPHLHTLPDHPEWIPYRTSYYRQTWGFCLPHRLLQSLPEGHYEVCIDASLEQGHLTYGECVLPGESTDEVLVSTHVCHPEMANDNVSGIVVAASLARALARTTRRFTYRLLFIPGTIGSITWLALNEQNLPRIRHGLVLAGVGDAGPLTYKRSRRGDAETDRAAAHVLRLRGQETRVLDFSPYGYDERQFCSPGFNLPVGCLMRTPFGRYPEYHTSADNLDFIKPDSLADSLDACLEIVDIFEGNAAFRNLSPKGEPQLGRRGLFDTTGGRQHEKDFQMALLWVLNQSDGSNRLLDIAARARLPFRLIRKAADALREAGLLAPAEEERNTTSAPRGTSQRTGTAPFTDRRSDC
jgi:aminopeptidase-like protein